MKAETIFLNYVCDKLGASVPRIIDVFEKYNVLLLEYVEGKVFVVALHQPRKFSQGC